MKKLLVFALCAFVSLAALAATPAVEVKDTGNVYVDGVNVGAPADAIANNPALASPIQTALATFVAKVNTDQAAAVAAKEAEKQAAIDAAQATAAAALAAKQAYVDALKAQIVALGATPVAEGPE